MTAQNTFPRINTCTPPKSYCNWTRAPHVHGPCIFISAGLTATVLRTHAGDGAYNRLKVTIIHKLHQHASKNVAAFPCFAQDAHVPTVKVTVWPSPHTLHNVAFCETPRWTVRWSISQLRNPWPADAAGLDQNITPARTSASQDKHPLTNTNTATYTFLKRQDCSK